MARPLIRQWSVCEWACKINNPTPLLAIVSVSLMTVCTGSRFTQTTAGAASFSLSSNDVAILTCSCRKKHVCSRVL